MLLKKLNENYYIYVILCFVFLPINLLPQLFDSVSIDYAYEIGDFDAIELWYKERSRHFSLIFFYFINFFEKYTPLSPELFFDNFSIFFLILFCIEVKKYSLLFFSLEKKWANIAALFTAIFPVWHILVSFDIGLYLISFFFVLCGYRNFIKKNKVNKITGLFFIIFSFYIESNLSFVIGLAFIHLLLNHNKKRDDFYYSNFFTIFFISIAYYFFKSSYFPTQGGYANYNLLTLESVILAITNPRFFQNIINYSTYVVIFLWIPVIYFLHLIILNRDYVLKNDSNLKNLFDFKYNNNYFLLLILSFFATAPYLLINSVIPSIWYLSDYYQRHVFLLAPISAIFFSHMFKDMSKFNFLSKKINLSFYLFCFIFINLVFLNYGNLRKTEAYLFKKNLIIELKNYGSIPKGNVEIIGKNFPTELRNTEVSHLFYKAYNSAGWWGSLKWVSHDEEGKFLNPLPEFLDKKYSTIKILNDYINECNTSIYIKNDLKKIDRIKKFYIFHYKENYNLDKIVKRC